MPKAPEEQTAQTPDEGKEAPADAEKSPSLDEIRAAEEADKADKEDKEADVSGDADPAEGEEAKADDDTSEDEAKDDKADLVPEKAEDYDLTLPDVGLKDEKGEPVQFDPDDPLAAEFREWAMANKVPQGEVAKLLGIFANGQKATFDATQGAMTEAQEAAITAELAKLETKGEDNKTISGEQRITRLMAGLKTVLGDGASTAISKGFTNAETVIAIEALLAKLGEQNPTAGAATADFSDLKGGKLLDAVRASEKR